MECLKVRNWEKWQSYRKDRGQPPWIKIHRCVMRNVEWVSLSDAERGQLVAIWLLAADRDGVIPASPETIQKLCYMSKIPNINKFIELGFIEGTVTPERRQHGANMTHQRQRQNRIESTRTYSSDFLSFWNAYPKKHGKGAAWTAWKKNGRKNVSIDVILKAIEKQQKSKQWQKDDGQYIPYPATWLNQHRWEDEIETEDERTSYREWIPEKR